MFGKKEEIDTYKQISLNLEIKSDRFLYYKRKFQDIEKTMEIMPFWNNLWIWAYIIFSAVNLVFILLFIEKTFHNFKQFIPILIFIEDASYLDKTYLYSFFVIPLTTFVMTILLSYKFYNNYKLISYTLIILNTICNILFLLDIIKLIQMNYAIPL